jgi:hypothetical protein
MGMDSHLSTCVGTQSPKYLEKAQGHISLSHARVRRWFPGIARGVDGDGGCGHSGRGCFGAWGRGWRLRGRRGRQGSADAAGSADVAVLRADAGIYGVGGCGRSVTGMAAAGSAGIGRFSGCYGVGGCCGVDGCGNGTWVCGDGGCFCKMVTQTWDRLVGIRIGFFFVKR